ncbi:MAG: preprotein translocase subunit SecE [bacterium]|jgi:preprotein translocase subunit SecE
MSRWTNFVDRTKRFLRELRSELRKVIWPTRKETVQYAIVVVATVFVISLFIWVVDSIFSSLLKLIIS